MALFLGLDAGTTSVKAGLFNSSGLAIAIGRVEYSLETPAADWVELNPDVYWNACARAIHTVLDLSKIDPGEICAMAISSQGETVIPVGRDGLPLRTALIWLDNRSKQEALELEKLFGSHIYSVTGLSDVAPTWSACKILWIKKNQPEIFDLVYKFLLVQDYLVFRLTGKFITEGSVSSSTMMYDIVHDIWWDDMLAALQIKKEQLPEISKAGIIVGGITREAAGFLGLKPNTPVVLGGMDQAVGAIGAGNIRAGIISETTGAALALQASTPSFNFEPRDKVPVYRHSIPDLFLVSPFCPTAGMALKWFRDEFCQTETELAIERDSDVYDLLTSLAEKIPPGAEGLLMLPHLSGSLNPVYNPEARGVFSGFTLGHHRGHFVRAIMEAVAFMLRRNLDLILASGFHAEEIRNSGGGARSPLWNQIKADVCGLPVITLASEEAALLGDAILDSVAVGEFGSLQKACEQMVALKGRIEPGANQSVYFHYYQLYCKLDNYMDAYSRID